MANHTGKTLGNYQIEERLGKGGMAEVYKAYHAKLDRFVTVKILHPHLIEGEDFLARFEREARAVAGLRHENIVQIHDYSVQDELYYMVMEYVDGGTLGEKLLEATKAGDFLPIRQVLSIIKQIGKALDYANRQDILHRDIKPSNILLDSKGKAFLTDFGIARMMSDSQFTATGTLIGTPTYMSPEQGQGLELDFASDIYSLGIVSFEMLTGKAPFVSETPLAVIHKHIHERLPQPSELRPDIPGSVEKVVSKALEKDRQNRYESAAAFSRALGDALTPEVIAVLDAVDTEGERTQASLPTMQMDSAPEPERADMPTVAMGTETLAEISGQPASEPDSEPASTTLETPTPEELTAIAEQHPQPPEKREPVVQEVSIPSSRSTKSQFTSRPVMLTIFGVLVLVALLFAYNTFFGSASCSNVESCMVLVEERISQDDPEGALDAIDRAISMVPDEEHQPYFWLWCDRGGLLEALGRPDEAGESYETCAAWEHGE